MSGWSLPLLTMIKKKEQPNMWITSINDFKGQIWIKGAYLQCGWEMAE